MVDERERPTAYADVIRLAVRRMRLALAMEQAQLARRMSALGYSWHPQTVSNVENGKRRLSAEELLGLALSLETPVSEFLRPFVASVRREPPVTLPSGAEILPSAVAQSVGSGRHPAWVVLWDGDIPRWPTGETLKEVADLEEERSRILRQFTSAATDAEDLQELAEQTMLRVREIEARLKDLRGADSDRDEGPPVSLRVYETALRMHEAHPETARPSLEDFAHLDKKEGDLE